jgi:hypothetical protein
MKTSLLLALALGTAMSALGQGTVQFANDARSLITNVFTGALAAPGGNFTAGLYYALDDVWDADRYILIATTPVGPEPGRCDGGIVTTPSLTAPGGFAMFQVRVWETAYGASYEQALAAPARNCRRALVGASNLVRTRTGDGGSLPPGSLTNCCTDRTWSMVSCSVDLAPGLRVADLVVAEPGDTASYLYLYAQLTPASAQPVTFHYRIEPGTAEPGRDFILYPYSGFASLRAGERSVFLGYMHILPDSRVEPDETIVVTLSDVTGAPIAQCQATITIRDAGVPASTMDRSNRLAYAANAGWLDWRPDGTNGVAVGEFICSGFIHGANVGWIHLGDGTPANGVRYANTDGADCGVNHDGLGNLRGLAWSANLGWVNFENTGAPKFDLLTGRFSGHVWSANAGWISLTNASAHIQTEHLAPATDSDDDGIPDAWEIVHTNGLTPFHSASDSDGDGVSDLREYLAGTHPLNPSSNLVAVTEPVSGVGPSPMKVSWTAMPGRVYRVEMRNDLRPETPWVDAGLVGDPSRISGVGPSPMRAEFEFGSSPIYRLFGVGPSPMQEVAGVGPSPMRLFRVVVQSPLSDP